MISKLESNLDILNLNDTKEFINYLCKYYRVSQKDLVIAYNQKYNTHITQQSFNKSVNNNSLKFTVIINLIKLLDCNLLIKHNHKPII